MATKVCLAVRALGAIASIKVSRRRAARLSSSVASGAMGSAGMAKVSQWRVRCLGFDSRCARCGGGCYGTDSTSLGAAACFVTMFTVVPGGKLGPEMPALNNWSKADVNDVVTTSEGTNSRMKRRPGEKKGRRRDIKKRLDAMQ